MHEFEFSVKSTAPPEAIWPRLADSMRWPEWTPLPRPTLVREGSPIPSGLGAIRRFTFVGPIHADEEIVTWDAPHHYGYAVIAGMPIRGYRAWVQLIPSGGGTVISWRGRFDSTTVPGTAGLLRFGTKTLLRRFARALARQAEAAVAAPA